MNIINISERKLKKLTKLEFSSHVMNTESFIYKYYRKDKWNNELYALKEFRIIGNEVFSNKLYTLNELVNHKAEINIDEIVMPTALVAISSEIKGYIMPYIEHINLGDALANNDISRYTKIDYLKQIGEILEKLKKVRKYTSVKKIFINDLHESNFIVDKNNKIKVVDVDSFKIGNNLPSPSRYLSPFSDIYDVPKYKKTKENIIGGIYRIDENTDLYCYTIMILNFLYGSKITSVSSQDYYSYLNYLKFLGLDNNLYEIFRNIYTTAPNINPLEYLDTLKNLPDKTKKIDYYKS